MEVFQKRGDVALRDAGSGQLRGWMVALGDLRGLCQPERFCHSVIESPILSSPAQTGTAGSHKKPLSAAAPGRRFPEPAPKAPWEQAGTSP